jgi:hypothetical protein
MEGLIRKIVLGQNPKDAMAYYVGMRAGSGEVNCCHGANLVNNSISIDGEVYGGHQ